MAEYRILVVDDDPDIVQLVSDALEFEGFNVVSTQNLADTRKHLDHTLPDLVILDLMLPDGNGLDLCRDFARDQRTRDIPIMMLTCKNSLDDRLSGFMSGARKYITKPFMIDDLVSSVRTLLRQNDTPAQ